MTSKQERCARWVWCYITRYPYVSAKDIAGAQTDYGYSEVMRALLDLEAGGQIKRSDQNVNGGYYQWIAIVPFVVQAPTWAAR